MFGIKNKNTKLINLLENDENYVSKEIKKSEYKKKWAFLSDEIIIGCLSGLWCFIKIEGISYGLNGNAISKYNIQSVHDAKKTKKGHSISDFIQIALNLKL